MAVLFIMSRSNFIFILETIYIHIYHDFSGW